MAAAENADANTEYIDELLPDTNLTQKDDHYDDSDNDMRYAYSDSDFNLSENDNDDDNITNKIEIRKPIQKSKLLPLPHGRLYECELLISHLIRLLISSNIIFPYSIIQFISSLSCFNLSVRIIRPISLRTEGWDYQLIHVLQLRQIQVFEKCVDKINNKQCEILCRLQLYASSDSISNTDVVIDDNMISTNENSYNHCINDYKFDHFMEFDINTIYAGNAFDISKIIIFNRNDKVERLFGCKVQLIYDHNIIAKEYIMKQFNTECVWTLNRLKVDIPIIWKLLIYGWIRKQLKEHWILTHHQLILLIVSFYSDPITPDSSYSIQARSMFDRHYRKCFDFSNNNTNDLTQTSDLYGRSNSRFIPIDSNNQYYYIQVLYWGNNYRKYIGITDIPRYKRLTLVNYKKQAAVFKLVMIHCKDEFIHYRLRYDENYIDDDDIDDENELNVMNMDENCIFDDGDEDIKDDGARSYFVGTDHKFQHNILYPIKENRYKLKTNLILEDGKKNEILEYDYISIESVNKNFKKYLCCKGTTGYCYGSDDIHSSRFQLVAVNNNDNDLYYIRDLNIDNKENGDYWLGIEHNKQIHAKLLKLSNKMEERGIFKLIRRKHDEMGILFSIFVYNDNFVTGWLNSGTILDYSICDSEADASLYRLILTPNHYIFTYCIVPYSYYTQESLPNSTNIFAIYSWSSNRYIDYRINNRFICETLLRKQGSRFRFIAVRRSHKKQKDDECYYYIRNRYPDSTYDEWLGFELNVDRFLNNDDDFRKYRVRLYRNESQRAIWKFVKYEEEQSDCNEMKFYVFGKNSSGNGWLNCDFDRWNNWNYLYENKKKAGLYSCRLHSKKPSFQYLTLCRDN